MKPMRQFYFLFIAGIAGVAILFSSAQAQPMPGFSLTSAFANGSTIPTVYTCGGANQSPPLKWEGVPAGTRSLALILKDPDAPRGTFIHWVLYNLSANLRELYKDVARGSTVTLAQQGRNGLGRQGYFGPCPPPGKLHHYHFVLYAVDTKLALASGATAAQVESALRGHVLASVDLVGTYER